MNNFSDHYFSEAKLGVFRQFANLFSNQKAININLDKDLVFPPTEINAQAFTNIKNLLANSYKSNIELKKRKKTAKGYGKDKVLQRMTRRKEMDIQAGTQVTNAYKVNIKGGEELLGPNKGIMANAYETGRHIIHNGYIVLIITEDVTNRSKYWVGADKLGLKLFKELTGENMDMWVSLNRPDRESSPDTTKTKSPLEKKPEKKGKYTIVKVGPGTQIANSFLNEIKEKWGTPGTPGTEFADNFSNIKKNEVIINNKHKIGFDYKLKDSGTTIGIYGPGKNSDFTLIVFYDNEESIHEAERLKLFSSLTSIDRPEKQIFGSVENISDLERLK